MTCATAAGSGFRFALSQEELSAAAQAVPGLTLPSFATAERHVHDRGVGGGNGRTETDARVLLALALPARSARVGLLVAWSPGEVVRRSLGVTGGVTGSLSRTDRCGPAAAARTTPEYEAALLPSTGVARDGARLVRATGREQNPGAASVAVPIAASRALVEAARRGDPALRESVAAQLAVPAAAARALDGLQERFGWGVRARFFDGRSGRCVAAGDWVATDDGWRRLRLGLRGDPPGPAAPRRPAGALTAQRLMEDGTIVVSPVTAESVRCSLRWMLTALVRGAVR
jgi:hypothetical protein